MAAIAPDPTASAAPGWLGSFVETGSRAPARRSRIASPRPDGSSRRSGARRPTTSRAPRRPRGGPARLGRDELPGAGPRPAPRRRDLRGEPRRVRHLDPARDRRLAQQDAPRVELRLPARSSTRRRCRPSRTARSCRRASRAGSRWSAGSRSASSARSRRGTRRGAGDARRRARAGARQRRRPQAGPADAGRRRRDVRGGLPRGGPARGAAPGRRRRRRRRRGARDRPQHPGRVLHRLDRRSGGASASWPAACSRRSRSSSAATTRSSSSTTPTSMRPPPRARSPRSSSRARSASPPAATSSIAAWPTPYIAPSRTRRSASGRATRTARTSSSGPIVNEKQIARVDGIVQRSIDGRRGRSTGATFEGLFYRPTVLTSVTQDMPAFTDEIFGPVAPITVFDTEEEAVALANASAYGLVRRSTRARRRAGWRWPTGCGPAWST